ncbi:MAG: dihydropyrimidinase [Treponema sp.]|jgi:dihydropyrimidinase|nr:dihydropyrimidinase [Treponema sp.]
MFDILIKNGKIVTPLSTFEGDIGVRDEKIAAVGASLGEAVRIIDAAGKYVLPGLVDPHMHIAAPFGGNIDVLDFYSAGRAAAFGGVTTIMDFCNTTPGQSVLESLHKRREEMFKGSLDFGIHAKFVEANDRLLSEIRDIVDFGSPSFKMFMTYRRAGVMIDDAGLLKVLAEAARQGGMCGFHAESNPIAEYNEDRLLAEGKRDWKYFPLCKPNVCEYEAVSRVLHYAAFLDAPVYFFHLSTAEAVEMVRRARKQGVKVQAETCTHYLTLTGAKNEGPDGILYLMSPPLRGESDREALWRALAEGVLSLVSSDNCSFTRELKEIGLDRDGNGNVVPDFTRVVNGVCGLEERLGLLLAAGVQKGRISLNKLVEIASANPARIFGCYPQKGALDPGSDADIVILDPEKQMWLSAENLHYGLDYSIYDDFTSPMWPVMTIRRGEILVENGRFLGRENTGRFLKRKLGKH